MDLIIRNYYGVLEWGKNWNMSDKKNFVTAHPQPQPNSTSTQVGVDKEISWTTTTTTHPTTT